MAKHSTPTQEEKGPVKNKGIPYANEGSKYFKRLMRDLARYSKHIRVKRIRYGFYRIYWKEAYVHEVYKEMPYRGYSWVSDNPYHESFRWVQEHEQDGELQRKVKNFVEGYTEASKAIKLRIYQFKHNKEHYQMAKDMYKTVVIK